MAEKYYVSIPFPAFGAHPPPGLLISLGDGTACEVTAAEWRTAWNYAYAPGAPPDQVFKIAVDLLIAQAKLRGQQAQEARDV